VPVLDTPAGLGALLLPAGLRTIMVTQPELSAAAIETTAAATAAAAAAEPEAAPASFDKAQQVGPAACLSESMPWPRQQLQRQRLLLWVHLLLLLPELLCLLPQ